MIRLQDVTKVYAGRRQSVTALQAASLEIKAGEYVAVVGPSGSGKTTLLSLFGGMLSPNEGKVFVNGVSVYDQPVAARAALRRAQIGFVFQTFNLVPYLTAMENVQIPLYLAGLPAAGQRARAIELLGQVGLADRVDHKPGELSTGQQQRVALARTLANNPPIILADEPTGNLDPDSRRMVLDFFDALNAEGRTIVTVTHDEAAAQRAGRRIRLNAGAIESISAPRERRAA
jgi:putative ABC transport system ATP-binding protein